MTRFGYIRISSTSQEKNYSLENQRKALESVDVQRENIFDEVASGESMQRKDRPVLHQVLGKMDEGDVLVVTTLDRFGRTILGCLFEINKLFLRGCLFSHLDGPALDWTSSTDVIRTALLAFLGESELRIRKERTRVGIERAKLDGKYKGRRTKCTPVLVQQIKKYRNKNLSCGEICKLLKIGKSTYYKVVKTLQ